jgi:hypothetical protein
MKFELKQNIISGVFLQRQKWIVIYYVKKLIIDDPFLTFKKDSANLFISFF